MAAARGSQTGAVFEEKLGAATRAYPAGSRYLIGVSGGRDSVALLHGLANLGYRRLIVAHLDHGLRGRTARADARFVGRLAACLGLEVELASTDVAAVARRDKMSLETAARNERRRFFAQVSARRRCRTIFLAHQADDQVETFLFNLLRGAGPAGLAGMRVESEQQIGGRKLRIVRPLLSIWRSEINDYLSRHGCKWREDASNAETVAYTRNRLRAEILPALSAAMGRDVGPALWRTADVLGAEEEWITTLLLAGQSAQPDLAVAALRSEPLAKRRRLIRGWLLAQNLAGIGYEEVELVRGLIDPNLRNPAKINLPGGRHVRRRAGILFVE